MSGVYQQLCLSLSVIISRVLPFQPAYAVSSVVSAPPLVTGSYSPPQSWAQTGPPEPSGGLLKVLGCEDGLHFIREGHVVYI